MFPLPAEALQVLVTFGFIGAALVGIGLLTTVGSRLGCRLLAAVARAAHRRGLSVPGWERHSAPKRDRSVLLVSRVLRAVSARLPGTPRTNTKTIIVPVLVVGVPVFLAALLALWAVPVALFGYVWNQGSGVLAFLSLCGYFGAFVGVWEIGKRIPVLVRRPRR